MSLSLSTASLLFVLLLSERTFFLREPLHYTLGLASLGSLTVTECEGGESSGRARRQIKIISRVQAIYPRHWRLGPLGRRWHRDQGPWGKVDADNWHRWKPALGKWHSLTTVEKFVSRVCVSSPVTTLGCNEDMSVCLTSETGRAATDKC